MKQEKEKIYKLVQIQCGKRIDKFSTFDINEAIKYHKWFTARYKIGLMLEIIDKKSVYDWKSTTKKFIFKKL